MSSGRGSTVVARRVLLLPLLTVAMGMNMGSTARAGSAAESDATAAEPGPTPADGAFGDGTIGRTIWDGDVGEGSLAEYADMLYDPAKEILRVEPDPAGVSWHPATGHSGTRRVIRMTVANDSRDRAYRSPKHRVQAASPGVIPLERNASAGADPAKVRYIGWAVYVPNTFPLFHRPGSVGWLSNGVDQRVQQNSIWSVYGPPYDGAGGLGARFVGSEPDQRLSIGATSGGQLWSMQADRGTSQDIAGRWVDVVVKVLMHAGRTKGRIQLWVNTGSGYTAVPLDGGSTTWTGPTLSDAHDDSPNYSKVSVYVNDNAFNTSTNPRGLATMYFAEHRIGTGFAAVAPRSHG